MTISAFILVGILSTGLLGGCRTQTASFSPQESTKYSIESSGKFARLDVATQTSIICTGLQERLNEAGHLAVVANVKNREHREIQVRVRCVFKDADGFTTRDETAWQLITLGDEGTEAVHFAASNLLAKKYTVLVRSP